MEERRKGATARYHVMLICVFCHWAHLYFIFLLPLHSYQLLDLRYLKQEVVCPIAQSAGEAKGRI